ncbi:flagellar hook-length control protein FliK [[Erwinia] mediterraneensis]|uniref:flagellar hook-length control protein FliK n=1 Tax=[Erwinia] mediterraneensis TaxID=2161819 RepID=UPI001031843E|nr:flagellar hook-length control protein FliK [[Erwinia] mediterraneensis]
MITLPNIITSTPVTGRAGEGESVPQGDGAPGIAGLPQDFLAELGQQLLTLANQPQDLAQTAEKPVDAEAKAAPTEALDALLASLENPDTLNTLLSPEKIKAALKSADDKGNSETVTLSATDQQNLQALFAMLPVTVRSAENQPGINLRPAGAQSAPLTAASLLSARSDATQETGSVLTGTQAQEGNRTHASGAQTLSAAPLTLDSSFRQASGSLEEKSFTVDTQPGSSPASAMLSSASAVSAPVTPSANISSPSTPMLNAQLGSSEWQQALSQQILMFTRNGQQNAELHLHPADLGAIQISLKLDNDQAQLNMVSSHSQVRAALEAAMPQLRSALAESGINLGQSNVSSDAFAQGQGYQGQQEARRDGQHGRFPLAAESDGDITPIAVPASLQARVNGNGAVDTFA